MAVQVLLIPCGACSVRREGGTCSVGGRPESTDDGVSVVSCRLGLPDELKGRGRKFSSELGSCLQLSKTCGFVGFEASQSGRHRVDWHRRSSMAEKSQVPDGRLSDR